MQQAELENSRVHTPSRHVTDRKQNVDFVHKVEEQIITEELINTIRSQSIDNHREETIERNVMNISTSERQINEAVNNISEESKEDIKEANISIGNILTDLARIKANIPEEV